MTLDEISILLGLKTDGLKKGAKEAENAISGMTSTIVSKLGVLSAAAAAAFSVFSRFGEYVAQADAMGKLADALDVDIEKMHAWGEAAARAGGSVESFQGSLQSLTAQLARQATTGQSRAAKLLEGAGIDAGEVGRQRKAFDVMMDLAEKAETMGKQEFFGLGRSLGLDQGTIMLLQQGRAALKEQIRLQKEFGVYTKEDAKVTADWNDRVSDFKQSMMKLASVIIRMVLPFATKALAILNKAIAFLARCERPIKIVAVALSFVLAPAIAQVSKELWKLAFNPALLKIAAIAALIAGLALVIDDFWGWTEGKESAIPWEKWFGPADDARKKIEELGKGFDKLIDSAKNTFAVIPEVIKIFVNAAEAILNGFFNLAEAGFLRVAKAAEKIIAPYAAKGQAIIGDVTPLTPEQIADAEERGKADGGIFTNPTRALIGEAGAEAVIPFSPGKRNRGLELLSKIAGNLMPNISASQALPMGGATTNNITTDTRVNVGNVTINAADGTDAANQFMNGIESRASAWTAAANVAY